MTDRPIVVLGLGNIICSDDGVGVAAIHRLLAAHEPPPGVSLVDGCTLGLALLDLLHPDMELILLDAVGADAPVGTLVRFDGDDVEPATRSHLSVHQVGVSDLLQAARWIGRMPARVVLLGIVPKTVALGADRTPAVEAAIPELMAAAERELAALGRPLRPREASNADPEPWDVARALGL